MPVVRISDQLFREVQKYAEPLVDNFETALWKALHASSGVARSGGVAPRPRRQGNLTPPKDFWRPVLETLVQRGGQARPQEVVEGVGTKMKGSMRAGDSELNRDGTPKWVKQAHFQRLAMVHKGLIASNSPRGVWTITEEGRRWLQGGHDAS